MPQLLAKVEDRGKQSKEQGMRCDPSKDEYVAVASTVTKDKVEAEGRGEKDQYLSWGRGKKEKDVTKMSQLIAKNEDEVKVGQQQQSAECVLLLLLARPIS